MKKLLFICTLLWLPTILFTWTPDSHFYYWRHQLTILSGLMALACMTLSMLLAMRLRWVEEWVHGLDMGYAIHRQMGIGALVLLVLHWVIIQLPHWLIPLGWLAPPQRGPRPELAPQAIDWTHLAKEVGNYSFYIFLIFAAISLLQIVRYRSFRWTHNIAGAIYLAGVFHSLLLIDINWPSIAENSAIVILCIIGAICAVVSLTGRIGVKNKSQGVVTNVNRIMSENQLTDVVHFTIQLDTDIHYQPGQFAFVNFHDGEPAHPFSVLDYQSETHTVDFAVKKLGDYTTKLMTRLNTTQRVSVEGGYGKFQIPPQEHQAWVGAGIGIVPFIAWLHQLTRLPLHSRKTIHLFYCRRSEKETYLGDMLTSLITRLPYVQLHIFNSDKGEYLTSEVIANHLNLPTSCVSFCGPVPFAQQLKQELYALGLAKNHFHAERFKMR